MKREIAYKKIIHQKEFHDDLTSRFLHLSGGFGCGKTYSLVMKALQLSAINAPFPGGLVCPSYADYVKDVLPTFEEILDRNRIPYKYHGTEKWFRFPWSPGKLYIETGDRRIRGPNWAYALLNELTLMPLIRYREVISRVRIKGSKAPQIASSGTPEGLASEFYEILIEKPWPGVRVIYGRTEDNKENLSDIYISNLDASFDPLVLQAYKDGLFINMNGRPFYYSFNPKICHDRNIKQDLHAPVVCFMDFNVDPMIATFWHYNGQSLRGFDEIAMVGTDTTRLTLDEMNKRGYLPYNTEIYPDPAGKARASNGLPDVTILENAGYVVHTRSRAPTMRGRQLNVNNLLSRGVIKFNPDKMPFMNKDLAGVETDPATGEKIKKNPKMTHASDGLDCGTDILFPFSGRRAETEIVRIR